MYINRISTSKGKQNEEFTVCCDNSLEQHVLELSREQTIPNLVLCNKTRLINDLSKGAQREQQSNMIEFYMQFEGEENWADTGVLNLNKGN